MKKAVIISVILCTLPLAVYLILRDIEREDLQPAKEGSIGEKEISTNLKAPIKKINENKRDNHSVRLKVNQSLSLKSNSQDDHSPFMASELKKMKDMKVLHVEIIDKMAIAFGDVIMGEVEDTGRDVQKQGFIEATQNHFWDNNKIPYVIDLPADQKQEVEKALKILNQTTVMEFVPWDGQNEDVIVYKKGERHCYSYLGKIGGLQPIFLSSKCKVTEILHETLHALGMIHEQSRTDRDEYVEILWENIQPEFYMQFQFVPESYMEAVDGTDFDFNSIMIYRPTFFSKSPDLITMKSKSNQKIEPTSNQLSKTDVERLDRIYGK